MGSSDMLAMHATEKVRAMIETWPKCAGDSRNWTSTGTTPAWCKAMTRSLSVLSCARARAPSSAASTNPPDTMSMRWRMVLVRASCPFTPSAAGRGAMPGEAEDMPSAMGGRPRPPRPPAPAPRGGSAPSRARVPWKIWRNLAWSPLRRWNSTTRAEVERARCQRRTTNSTMQALLAWQHFHLPLAALNAKSTSCSVSEAATSAATSRASRPPSSAM
mmetsp:Transcript_10551/g.30226  ORF Transcript_10551/g.30226 Transcript_10551/m.30226 type:complete len:217 (-) Transcript_10551:547-1197(-)